MKGFLNFIKCTGKRTLILIISSIVLFVLAIGTTVALIITKTDSYDNTFVPPIARISLEGYDDITNTGNVPVYVRAFAMANWLSIDDEHTISSETPRYGMDYTITLVTEDWFLASDGFYYYKKPLAPGESVMLFTDAFQLQEKSGYELRLQLLSSSIQTDPIDAINDAWPAVQINEDGELENVPAP